MTYNLYHLYADINNSSVCISKVYCAACPTMDDFKMEPETAVLDKHPAPDQCGFNKSPPKEE
jgi:hypothetical protein